MTLEPPGDQSKLRAEGDWYSTWIPRALVVAVAAAAGWFGSQWVFGSLRDFLLTVVFAVFVAMALLPGVELLVKRGWRRGAATGLVMLAGVAFIVLFIAAITNVVVGQVIQFTEKAPEYVDNIVDTIKDVTGADVDADAILSELEQYEDELGAVAANAVNGVFGLASSTLGLVFQLLTVALFVFYILADLPRFRATLLRRFPTDEQAHIDTVLSITIEKTGGYVYTRSVLALASAAFHFLAFIVIGLPYAFALALWVGLVSQFIPTVGTYIAGAVPVIIALLDDPIKAVWVLLAIVVYQQIENYGIEPRVSSDTLDLHPAVAFGSVIAGGALLGGLGAVLALPIAASVTALVQTYGIHHDVIRSDTIPSPEEYEAQMRAQVEEKAKARSERQSWWSRLTTTGSKKK